MAIGRRWAGNAFGTNIGNLFVTFEGDDAALTGVLRFNEPSVGIAVYNVQGTFVASSLTLVGQPQAEIEHVQFGELKVTGTLNSRGEINGDWETTIGSAGTFVLFPHGGGDQGIAAAKVEQLHIARHAFGAIEINRSQIIKIAEDIRQEFPTVVITVAAGTEQARFLDDFKQFDFGIDRAEIIKIFASKAETGGVNQIVTLEFGPQVNSAMSQGASEAWVLGRLETLKRDIKPYERAYITSFKRWGININQFLLLSTVVFLPSMSGLRDRIVLMTAVLAIVFGVNWLHSKYVPYAAIYLREKKIGVLGRIWPSMASWAIGIIATALAALLAAYLQGWLEPQTEKTSTTIEAKAAK